MHLKIKNDNKKSCPHQEDVIFYSPRNQTTSCQYKLSKKRYCSAL